MASALARTSPALVKEPEKKDSGLQLITPISLTGATPPTAIPFT
jgi:hypothetical protein